REPGRRVARLRAVKERAVGREEGLLLRVLGVGRVAEQAPADALDLGRVLGELLVRTDPGPLPRGEVDGDAVLRLDSLFGNAHWSNPQRGNARSRPRAAHNFLRSCRTEIKAGGAGRAPARPSRSADQAAAAAAFSVARTRAGLIGALRIRTPVASKTAFA